jgi:hypothetical protein
MSDIFDAMHRRFFDQLFSLDEEGRKAKEKLLREAGVPEEMIAELTRPGIQPGMSFGGAKPVDVMNVVERVLFGQNAGHVLLRVKRPPFDEAGHIEKEGSSTWPRRRQRSSGGALGARTTAGWELRPATAPRRRR